MYDLVKELQSTNSQNDKIATLKEYGDNPHIKIGLDYALSPFKQFYIKKVPKIPQTGKKDYYTNFRGINSLLHRLETRLVTGNAAKDEIVAVLQEYNQETQDVVGLILRKNLKCNIGAKIVNKAIPGLIPEFNVQLANTYNPTKKYNNVNTWYASPKMDGLRCLGFVDTDKQVVQLFTRQGKPIFGLESIATNLYALYQKYGITFFDGELYASDLEFSQIQGYVIGNKSITPEQKEQIKYVLFAIDNPNIVDTYSMVQFLGNMRDECGLVKACSVHIVPYWSIPNKESVIQAKCAHFVKKGFEGIMLRHPDNHYVAKRDDNLLKYKMFKEDDFTIIGYFEGGGKYEGMLGGLKVQGQAKYGNNVVNVNSEVGSGFNDKQRQDLWANADSLIGKQVEIKYQDVTETNGAYSLRFPVFKKLKLDR